MRALLRDLRYGIRAPGAEERDVVWMVIEGGLGLTAAGAGMGRRWRSGWRGCWWGFSLA